MGKAINMVVGKLVNQENRSVTQYKPVITLKNSVTCNFYSLKKNSSDR